MVRPKKNNAEKKAAAEPAKPEQEPTPPVETAPVAPEIPGANLLTSRENKRLAVVSTEVLSLKKRAADLQARYLETLYSIAAMTGEELTSEEKESLEVIQAANDLELCSQLTQFVIGKKKIARKAALQRELAGLEALDGIPKASEVETIIADDPATAERQTSAENPDGDNEDCPV